MLSKNVPFQIKSLTCFHVKGRRLQVPLKYPHGSVLTELCIHIESNDTDVQASADCPPGVSADWSAGRLCAEEGRDARTHAHKHAHTHAHTDAGGDHPAHP